MKKDDLLTERSSILKKHTHNSFPFIHLGFFPIKSRSYGPTQQNETKQKNKTWPCQPIGHLFFVTMLEKKKNFKQNIFGREFGTHIFLFDSI